MTDYAPSCIACGRELATITMVYADTGERVPIGPVCARMLEHLARLLGVKNPKRRPALRLVK